MAPSALKGRPEARRSPSRDRYPMRALNGRQFGLTRCRDGSVNPCRKLGGCGRSFAPFRDARDSDVVVFERQGKWRPGDVAMCNNALLCDHCAPIREAESRDRWRWHLDDWMAGGGVLVQLRLSLPHRRSSGLKDLLKTLTKLFASLRRSAAWRDTGIVDWVRVVHLRWGREHGWNLHFHVTGLVHPKLIVADDGPAELVATWRQRVAKAGFSKVSGRHGMWARTLANGMRRLYAWTSWVDEGDDYEPEHQLDQPDYEPDHQLNDEGTMSLRQMARLALAGDTQCYAAWTEAAVAMKGCPITRASRTLDRIWAELGPKRAPAVPADEKPVARVAAGLWELARTADVAEAGLEVGERQGHAALAAWWHTQLGVPVALNRSLSPPRIYLSDPQGARHALPSAIRRQPGEADNRPGHFRPGLGRSRARPGGDHAQAPPPLRHRHSGGRWPA